MPRNKELIDFAAASEIINRNKQASMQTAVQAVQMIDTMVGREMQQQESEHRIQMDNKRLTMELENSVIQRRADIARTNASESDLRLKNLQIDQVEKAQKETNTAIERVGAWNKNAQSLYQTEKQAKQPTDLLGSMISLDQYNDAYSKDPEVQQVMADQATLEKAGHVGLPPQLTHPSLIEDGINQRFGKIEIDLTDDEVTTVNYGLMPDTDSGGSPKQDYETTKRKRVAWDPRTIKLKAQSGNPKEKRVAIRMLIQAGSEASRKDLPDWIKRTVPGDLAPLGLHNLDERLPDLFDKATVDSWDAAINAPLSGTSDPAVQKLRETIAAARAGNPVAINQIKERIKEDNPSTQVGVMALVFPNGEPVAGKVRPPLRALRDEAIDYANATPANKSAIEKRWSDTLKTSGHDDKDINYRISLLREMADSVTEQTKAQYRENFLRGTQRTLMNVSRSAGYAFGQAAMLPVDLVHPAAGIAGGLVIGAGWDNFLDEATKFMGVEQDLGAQTKGEVAMDIVQQVAFSGAMAPTPIRPTDYKFVPKDTGGKELIAGKPLDSGALFNEGVGGQQVGTQGAAFVNAVGKTKLFNGIRELLGYKPKDPLEGFTKFRAEKDVKDLFTTLPKSERILPSGRPVAERTLPPASLKTRTAATEAERMAEAARVAAADMPYPAPKSTYTRQLEAHNPDQILSERIKSFEKRVRTVMENYKEPPKVDPRMRSQRALLDRSVNENLVNALRKTSESVAVNRSGISSNPRFATKTTGGDLFVVDKRDVAPLVREAQTLVDELQSYTKATPEQVRLLMPSRIIPRFSAWYESVVATHGQEVADRLLNVTVKLGGL